MKKIFLALSLCAATALVANEADYYWEFTPVIGGVTPEGNTGLDTELTYGARIAYNFGNEWWLDQIEFGYDRSDDMDVDGGGDVDLNMYHLNLVKNIYSFTDNFKLYGLVGGGYMDFSGGSDNDTGFGQYGLGLKYYWTDWFSTKLEARHAITFDEGDSFLFYNLGFGFNFGKRSQVVPVNVVGDSDGDGVPDDIDRCPNTPAGVVVDEFGCEKIIRLRLDNFAFDSAEIKPEFKNEIRKVSNFMAEHPDYTTVLEGHTDSTGDANYNQKLSERRAVAVSKELQGLGVEASRITTKGFGETKPIADNNTKAGRAENRRVDAKFNK
ncbi:MAG: OmpA family protein [Campylobacter sp.]|nr:OmpA family protein [Campylobacter sp.]